MNRYAPHTERHGSVVHSGDGSQWLQEFMQEQHMQEFERSNRTAPRAAFSGGYGNLRPADAMPRRLWLRPALTFAAAAVLVAVGLLAAAAL